MAPSASCTTLGLSSAGKRSPERRHRVNSASAKSPARARRHSSSSAARCSTGT